MREQLRNGKVWVTTLVLATSFGCGAKRAEQPGAEPAKEPAAAQDPTAINSEALRCGDFLEVVQLTALGLNSSDFHPDETQTQLGRGVNCNFGGISLAIFRGSDFKGLIRGLEHGGKESGLQQHPGPTIGGETHWVRMDVIEELIFLSTNKHYAAVLAGQSQAKLEELGKLLDTNMNAR